MNSPSFPAHPKPPRIVSRCIVRGCSVEIGIDQVFCSRHVDMMAMAHAAEMFVAWEDFSLAVHASKTAKAFDALHRYMKAQRTARLAIEALEVSRGAYA